MSVHKSTISSAAGFLHGSSDDVAEVREEVMTRIPSAASSASCCLIFCWRRRNLLALS